MIQSCNKCFVYEIRDNADIIGNWFKLKSHKLIVGMTNFVPGLTIVGKSAKFDDRSFSK